MGNQIIKQPDGKFAVFSSIVDGIVLFDATPKEIIEDMVESERNRITEHVFKVVSALNVGGKPYHQFTIKWTEALRKHEKRFGKLPRAVAPVEVPKVNHNYFTAHYPHCLPDKGCRACDEQRGYEQGWEHCRLTMSGHLSHTAAEVPKK